MIIWKKFTSLTPYRQILYGVLLMGLGGSVASVFAQYVLDLNPCVMCIQQRVAMMVMTLLTLMMLLTPLAKKAVRVAVAMILSVPTGFGAYIATKQLYIQSLPITQQPSCGAPWTFRLRDAPLFDWYEPIIRGTGVCGEVQKLAGLSLPMWALLFFMVILLLLWGGLIWANRR